MNATPALPPPPPTRAEGMLAVGDGHEVFWEESGAADGIPALYLHGGPGGRLSPGYRRQSPEDRFRIIALSQRGSGRSTPSAGTAEAPDLSGQSTAALVADIERLREHLGVETWVLQGVSWGSTLALAYAEAHPERVLGIVLMAVTTTSRREVDWITEDVGALYPEAWDAFARFAERHGDFDRRDRSLQRVRIVEAYRRLVQDPDPALAEAAATAWCRWEDEHIRIGSGEGARPHAAASPDAEELAQQRTFARLVTHYWAHDGFVTDWAAPWGAVPGSGLLGGAHRLAGIPGRADPRPAGRLRARRDGVGAAPCLARQRARDHRGRRARRTSDGRPLACGDGTVRAGSLRARSVRPCPRTPPSHPRCAAPACARSTRSPST